MIAELRAKSQITIPKNIINSLKINIGDKLEIIEQDGYIKIIPVAVYPKAYVEELECEVKNIKSKIQNNKQTIFSDIDFMLTTLS